MSVCTFPSQFMIIFTFGIIHTRVCIIINAGMPWYDDVHHHLLIYDHTGPVLFCKTKKFVNCDLHVTARAFLPLIKSQSLCFPIMTVSNSLKDNALSR